LRIISGTERGRKLLSPKSRSKKSSAGGPIRPTSDLVREAIFNIIGQAAVRGPVLDLFAGTGALGLEALSRGAEAACFIDKSSQAITIINKNIKLCGFADRSQVIIRDLARGLSFFRNSIPAGGFELIFADPPYGKGLGAQVLLEIEAAAAISAGGLLVVEEMAGESMPEITGRLKLCDQRRYGDTAVWFYRVD